MTNSGETRAIAVNGWGANRKRVQRLWREEGLRVPARRRKRRRVGASTAPAGLLRATRVDEVWALDFQFDTTADGRVLKLLHVIDEHPREALSIVVERRIDADRVVEELTRLVAARGAAPAFIGMDNGPEFTANLIREWCQRSGSTTTYIEPGSPWQNPFVALPVSAWGACSDAWRGGLGGEPVDAAGVQEDPEPVVGE